MKQTTCTVYIFGSNTDILIAYGFIFMSPRYSNVKSFPFHHFHVHTSHLNSTFELWKNQLHVNLSVAGEGGQRYAKKKREISYVKIRDRTKLYFKDSNMFRFHVFATSNKIYAI